MKTLLTILFALLLSIAIFAQDTNRPTINGQFVYHQIDLTNMTYNVKLQINSDTPFIMEQVKARFTFNTNALEFNSVNVLNFNSENGYEASAYLSNDDKKIWVEINLLSESTTGFEVGTDYVDFLEFNFTILDPQQWSNICLFSSHIFRGVGISGNLTIGYFPCDEYPLPVELVSFTAQNINNKVILNWKTATEINNYGFNIERNGVNIGFVPGNGNSNSPKSYTFTDAPTASGTYVYRLRQIDSDGTTKLSNEISIDILLNRFSLEQNYPNPFNPTTVIGFYLNKSENIRLVVYNTLGQEIAVIADGFYKEGYNEIIFNANNLSSGLYIYQLQTNSNSIVKKMTLLK